MYIEISLLARLCKALDENEITEHIGPEGFTSLEEVTMKTEGWVFTFRP